MHLQDKATLPFENTLIECYTVSRDNPVIPPASTTGSVIQDGIVIPDPYEMYLKMLQPGEKPRELIVAKELHSLCSIMMLVDNQENIKAVVDPGSQIIAMSDTVCNDLGLSYDLTIQLNMQSANGTVDCSLGLARNIPCHLGNVTLYFQIHVIRDPAYNILLGRPFEVLTESVVRNFKNEDQTITIHDPNSNWISTVPILPRGKARFRVLQNIANQKASVVNFQILSRN